MADNYKYKPEIPEIFKCRVPLPGTVQAFIMSGRLRDDAVLPDGFSVKANRNRGVTIDISENSVIPENIQIISVREESEKGSLAFDSSIILNEGSSSNLLLCTHTLSLDSFETEETVDIKVKKGASANIVVMQNENNSSVHKTKYVINMDEDSVLKMTIVSLHGLDIKNEFESHINGSNASCGLNGLYLVDGTQQIATSVHMYHHVPQSKSTQLFKGILDNSSKASFTGKINVERDAQKTEAYQSNHNLLLARTAKAYVQPHLEIYADDVKCSHGATSGRLDDLALFYMRSRGIGKKEAKLLQQLAFVNDVLETISNDALKMRLQELVESRLRGEFSHCSNCSVNCC